MSEVPPGFEDFRDFFLNVLNSCSRAVSFTHSQVDNGNDIEVTYEMISNTDLLDLRPASSGTIRQRDKELFVIQYMKPNNWIFFFHKYGLGFANYASSSNIFTDLNDIAFEDRNAALIVKKRDFINNHKKVILSQIDLYHTGMTEYNASDLLDTFEHFINPINHQYPHIRLQVTNIITCNNQFPLVRDGVPDILTPPTYKVLNFNLIDLNAERTIQGSCSFHNEERSNRQYLDKGFFLWGDLQICLFINGHEGPNFTNIHQLGYRIDGSRSNTTTIRSHMQAHVSDYICEFYNELTQPTRQQGSGAAAAGPMIWTSMNQLLNIMHVYFDETKI
jgi:hypothetical protein